EHTAHAQSSHHSSEQGVRKASSVSVGEVQSRSHAEGQSDDHFESASREFTNPNQCHAVTFLFYQINKTQTVKYTLEAIERRVILDPANDFTKVALKPLEPTTAVRITSVNVLATDTQSRSRLAGQREDRPAFAAEGVPTVDLREAALKQVDQDLVKQGLLDKVGGNVSPAAKEKFSFDVESALPFKERKRVSRGGAFGIVVEVDVHGAVFFSPTFDARRPFPKRGLAIARCVFSGVTVQTDVNHVSCHSIPHWPVGRIRHADRDSVALEALRYFIIEPRLIAKLDRVSRAFPVPQIS